MTKWNKNLLVFKSQDWFQIMIFTMLIYLAYLILFWYYLPYLIEFHQGTNKEVESLYNFYILKSIPITVLFIGSVKREIILIRNLAIACFISKIILILEYQDLLFVRLFSNFIHSGRDSVLAALFFLTVGLALLLLYFNSGSRNSMNEIFEPN